MGTRMSVYMSDDLKQRMDAVAEPVNWSSLACAAFERKLGEIAARKTEKAMDDVIQRLRASKIDSDSELRRQGREDGVEWAKNKASVRDLRRLSASADRINIDRLLELVGNSEYGPGEHLVMCLVAEREFQPDAAAEFWQSAVGNDWEVLTNEPEYVCGFAEGAVEVWKQVRDRI